MNLSIPCGDKDIQTIIKTDGYGRDAQQVLEKLITSTHF